jgi:hypothetical protein
MSVNLKYQNYGIFTSSIPSLDELRFLNKDHNVKRILVLDRDAAQRDLYFIKNNNLDMKVDLFNINPGSPAGEASILFENILNYIPLNSQSSPILVHCRAGKDRTGFAIAAWLIKSGKANPCQAINEVESTIGYGAGGISEVAKRSMDRVLGCFEKNKTQEDLDKEKKLQDLIDGKSVDLDISNIEDIVSEMRDNFAHQQGGLSSGTVDGGYWADNIGYANDWIDGIAEKYPQDIRAAGLLRNRLYKLATFGGGGPQGSPTAEALPSGTGVPNIPEYITHAEGRKKRRDRLQRIINKIEEENSKRKGLPKQPLITEVGVSPSNMNPFLSNTFYPPSAAPNSANGAAGPTESAGYIQI